MVHANSQEERNFGYFIDMPVLDSTPFMQEKSGSFMYEIFRENLDTELVLK